jgi:hypothetical protein
MAARLSDCLAGAGLVPVETIRAAIARQAVYGGALDTALLELDAIDEGRLWQALGTATGLPLPPPALYQTPVRYEEPEGATTRLDESWSHRCRAVPAVLEGGSVAVVCGEPVARGDIEAAAAALGVGFTLFVVPEVRLAAMRQAIFGRPMPPRLVRLFARIAGTQPVRRWQAAQARPAVVAPAAAAEPPSPAAVERQPSPVAEPPRPAVAEPPSVVAEPPRPAVAEPPPAAAAAPSALGGAPPAAQIETVDKASVAALIRQLGGSKKEEVEAAHAALVRVTKQDFGTKPRRWETWWEKHQDDRRVEWLFEGLGHRQTTIRASAEEELRALTGQYFGYHFDLPRREREEARARWQSWWYESGRARRT